MILSEEGRAKVLQLQSGFFLDRALVGPDRFEIQFIVKAPFEIITAVHHGSKMFLWSGPAGDRDRGTLAATFTVEDDRDASFYLSRTLNPDQGSLLAVFFNERRGHVVFFDELNRALLTVQVSLSEQPYLERAKTFLTRRIEEPSEAQIKAALDDVDARVAERPKFLKSLCLLSAAAKPLNYSIPSLGFVPPANAADRFSRETHVDQEAGSKLEERIAQILRRRFPLEAILVSPWLSREERELCDVLVGCRWGYLFLESKAMAVNAAALDRSTERRLSGFRKQIEKALKQLDGVRRRVLSPDFTTVNTGLGTREIESYRHDLLHFAIAMSEIHPDLVKLEALWEAAIANAEQNKIALHLFDPHELQSMVSLSSSEKEFFDKLNNRWNIARERRTLVLHVAPTP
jgi:hypothetical protein